MGGRLSSLTRCIRNAIATWCEFCLEIRKKKQSPSSATLSQPNSNKDQNNKKKGKVFFPVCSIFICLIEMKTKAKRFYWTILLVVVLLCDLCVIVWYRVVSRAGLFGSGSGLKLTKIAGLIRAWDVRFVLGAQKYN